MFLVRNPFAAIEGIVRRASQQPIAMMSASLMLLLATLDILWNNSFGTSSGILMPEFDAIRRLMRLPKVGDRADTTISSSFGGVGIHQACRRKRGTAAPILDRNAEQIGRLTADQKAKARMALANYGGALAAFGY